MKIRSLTFVCVVFALVLLVSSSAELETSKDERKSQNSPDEYHVNQIGGGYGGPGGGWGGPGGGWGGRGGGGWGGRGGGGWGGRGRGGGGRSGCRFGCCGGWYRYRGCSQCCRSLTEAIAFNKNEATP